MENSKKTFLKFICLTWMNIVLFIMGNAIPLIGIYYAVNTRLEDKTNNPIIIIILCILWLVGYYYRIYSDYQAYKSND